MESLDARFFCLPLQDALVLSSDGLGELATKTQLIGFKKKRVVPQSEETTPFPEYHLLEAPDGKIHRLFMPEVLHLNTSNLPDNQDSKFQHAEMEDREQFMFDSLPSSELFPWPKTGSAITPQDNPTADNRKALFLRLRFDQRILSRLQADHHNSSQCDLCIHVFLNGTICNSRVVSFDEIKNINSSSPDEFFQGIKIEGTSMEKIWITGDSTEATHRSRRDNFTSMSGSATRWKDINQKMLKNVSSNSDAGRRTRYLSEYVSAIDDIPVPYGGLAASNTTFGVIDVILVRGFAKKHPIQEPTTKVQPSFTGDTRNFQPMHSIQDNATRFNVTTHADDEVGDVLSGYMGPLAETSDFVLGQTESISFNDWFNNVNNHPKIRSDCEISSGISPVAYPDESLVYQYDDEEDGLLFETRAIAQLRYQPNSRANDEWHNNQQSFAQSPYKFKSQNHHKDIRNTQNLSTRAPITGHISNLATFQRTEDRPVKAIAQYDGFRRKASKKRSRANMRDTSIASRHSSPASSSPGSGPTNSPSWPSTSSEIIRKRKAKLDLSLPRKKRRRGRYQSVDFDSEDAIATIPDKSVRENKIRIVSRNEKPLFPHQKEPELQGPASKLVAPIIHRNLRRKRERQFVKRNPEVGLTERDMYNWVEADYEARNGVKPWLERRDHEAVPLAQPLGEIEDRVAIANPGTNKQSAWDKFEHERRMAFKKEYRLMEGSAVTISDFITLPTTDEGDFEFESVEILEGGRFIFI